VIYPGESRLDEGKHSLGEPIGGAWMFIAEEQEPEGQESPAGFYWFNTPHSTPKILQG
jgi:hypothetical protein